MASVFGSLAPEVPPEQPNANMTPEMLELIRRRLVGVPPALQTTMPPEPVQEVMKGVAEPLTTAGWMLGGAMQGTEQPSTVDILKAAGGLGLAAMPMGPGEAGVLAAARAGTKALTAAERAGKKFSQFTPGEVGEFGRLHGVPNLGPASDAEFYSSLVPYQTKSGSGFTVPGGIEDPSKPFTYYDLLHMKAQGLNPNDLDPAHHHGIHTRFVNTMQPKDLKPEDIFNQLVFSMTSPANPLTPNEFATARIMARSPEDLDWIANLVPWKYGDKTHEGKRIIAQPRNAKPGEEVISRTGEGGYSDRVAQAFGVQAGAEGGLGTRGNADYTRIAELAQMIRDKPDFFRFKGAGEGGETNSENWARFVSRIASQTPGFAFKTGSFGTVWQSPVDAAISAIDRHMAGALEHSIFENPAERAAWREETLNLFNEGKPENKQASSIEEMVKKGGKNLYSDRLLDHLSGHPTPLMRTPKGEYGKGVPEWMKGVDWVQEPEKVTVPSKAYLRALEASQPGAEANKQGLFSNQWMVWDPLRHRLEPHEVMFPGLNKLPAMEMEQMKEAVKAHKELGYWKNRGGVGRTANPSSLGYFQLPLMTGTGGLTAAEILRQQQQQ